MLASCWFAEHRYSILHYVLELAAQQGIIIDVDQQSLTIIVGLVLFHGLLPVDHILESLILLSQLSDELVLGVLIDLGFGLDQRLHLVSIYQCGQAILVVDISWADRRHHRCFGIASQGVLKHPREFRLSVRYDDLLTPFLLGSLISQYINHFAEETQTFVDIGPLLLSLGIAACSSLPLTAGQIDKADLALLLVCGFATREEGLFQNDGDYGVGAGGGGVHVGGTDGPVVGADLNLISNIIITAHQDLAQTVHINPIILRFPDLEALLCPPFRIDEEVMYVLIVNLQHADRHLILGTIQFRHVGTLLDPNEHLLTAHWNDA